MVVVAAKTLTQLNNIFHQFYLQTEGTRAKRGNDIKLLFMALTYGISTYSALNRVDISHHQYDIRFHYRCGKKPSNRAESVRLFSFHSNIQYDTERYIECVRESEQFFVSYADGAMLLKKKSKGLLSFSCSLLLLLFFVGHGGGKVNSTAYCLCYSISATAACFT